MKKIKSVKLKREYRDTNHIIPSTQYGYRIPGDDENSIFWKFKTTKNSSYSFCENTVLANLTDLFEIEYEPETKFIDVRIEAPVIRYGIPSVEAISKLVKDTFHCPELKFTLLKEGIL